MAPSVEDLTAAWLRVLDEERDLDLEDCLESDFRFACFNFEAAAVFLSVDKDLFFFLIENNSLNSKEEKFI